MSILALTVFGEKTSDSIEEINKSLNILYRDSNNAGGLNEKQLKKLAKLEQYYLKQLNKSQSQSKQIRNYSRTQNIRESYDPTEIERNWYSYWEDNKLFIPEGGGQTFTMILPPPNVTGMLHLGHALTCAIEDSLVRWHRMLGKKVLWIPGCDHAGIATQTVVEKHLAREYGLTRFDLGRRQFIEETYNWTEKYGNTIYDQLKIMGASLDWSRETFTMDYKCYTAVTEAFIRFHDEGLIYRADRLVNWSCALNSVISDIEIDKLEIQGKTMINVPGYENPIQFGILISFAYKIDGIDEIDGSDSEIIVSTTRIETMLGDVAIAVHPDDQRYQKYVGKYCKHPFLDRKLRVVADRYVDMNFGTGAVKITPGHDINDFELAERHNLQCINILTGTGLMDNNCGEFSGMKRFDVRVSITNKLKEMNLFRGEVNNPMVIPICSRSGDIIEPLKVPQWYLNCDSMAKDVLASDIKIIPKSHEKTWFSWLENIHHWCISRQLWWGHRIPAYEVLDNSNNESIGWVSAHNIESAMEKAVHKFNVNPNQISLKQDEDVLDTWFSSGIFPLSTLGWPNNTIDLQEFYPNNLLETGHDILFFWVARMAMMCKKLIGKLPFDTVFLHAMIRDSQGRKMSKSLGNVIDPIDVRNGISLDNMILKLEKSNMCQKEIDIAKKDLHNNFPNGIPECGIDALRFALCNLTTSSHTVNINIDQIYGYRLFCNKIFNAVKFVKMYIKIDNGIVNRIVNSGGSFSEVILPINKWILSRVEFTTKLVNDSLECYDFNGATNSIHSFWLYDFCDYYIESIKPILKSNNDIANETREIMLHVTLTALKLLSPFMPFITEELWHKLHDKSNDESNNKSNCISIVTAPFPTSTSHIDVTLHTEFEYVKELVRSIRKGELKIDMKKDVIDKFKDVIEVLTKKKLEI